MAEKFTFFWNGPFSNWHPATFVADGVKYNCSEQYMMAEKARLFKDEASLKKIMASDSPKEQKACGRKISGFDKERWELIARGVVYKGCYEKFNQNLDLLKKLLDTAGTTLVEASPYDCIWGIGLAETNPKALDRATWRGKNWLGETLTKIREDLLKTVQSELLRERNRIDPKNTEPTKIS